MVAAQYLKLNSDDTTAEDFDPPSDDSDVEDVNAEQVGDDVNVSQVQVVDGSAGDDGPSVRKQMRSPTKRKPFERCSRTNQNATDCTSRSC